MQYISTQLLCAICKNAIFMPGQMSDVSHIIAMIGDGVYQMILLVTTVFFFSLQGLEVFQHFQILISKQTHPCLNSNIGEQMGIPETSYDPRNRSVWPAQSSAAPNNNVIFLTVAFLCAWNIQPDVKLLWRYLKHRKPQTILFIIYKIQDIIRFWKVYVCQLLWIAWSDFRRVKLGTY